MLLRRSRTPGKRTKPNLVRSFVYFLALDINVPTVSMKKRLHDYETQPSPDDERQKFKSIVEKTVKERSKILSEFVVRVMSISSE